MNIPRLSKRRRHVQYQMHASGGPTAIWQIGHIHGNYAVLDGLLHDSVSNVREGKEGLCMSDYSPKSDIERTDAKVSCLRNAIRDPSQTRPQNRILLHGISEAQRDLDGSVVATSVLPLSPMSKSTKGTYTNNLHSQICICETAADSGFYSSLTSCSLLAV
jgi:hypothetical protein